MTAVETAPPEEGARPPSVAPIARGAEPSTLSRDSLASESRKVASESEPPPPRRRNRFFRWPRRLRVTREGKYFIGITFGVGFAAINTGNNLLYLLLGMLLALVIVSGVMSELSLRRLTVVRRLPPRAQVGRPHLVEVEVHNHKGKIPSYAIEIEDLRAGQPADKRCFFLKISPDSAQVAAYRRTPARRGRDHHTGFRIATRFPFGLFEKSRETIEAGEIVIYPEVLPLRLPDERQGQLPGYDGSLGAGFGDDVVGVRPMREGDDYRDIYWRKSVGGRQWVVRERARESSRQVKLMIDSMYAESSPSEDWCTRFEDRIVEVASLAVAHIKRGDRVLVTTVAGESVVATQSVGADPLLRFLALLKCSSKTESLSSSKQEPSFLRTKNKKKGAA